MLISEKTCYSASSRSLPPKIKCLGRKNFLVLLKNFSTVLSLVYCVPDQKMKASVMLCSKFHVTREGN